MGKPQWLLTGPPKRGGEQRSELRRVEVPVPSQGPTTDATYFILRRMRVPLFVVVGIFTIAVVGLTFIPYTGDDGKSHTMSFFDAFYFISYAGTTIGFGEPAAGFSDGQRLWTTYTIYFMVVGWAYALGSFVAALQDPALKKALALGRFRRKVRRMTEPFFILCGHGQVGRAVAMSMDALGRRIVVIDPLDDPQEALSTDVLSLEIPALNADARDPLVLGMAGLGHRHCEGVLALAKDDNINLAIVMAVQLLRPEIPVISRASDRAAAASMADFGALAVVNPFDTFGNYLTLRLHQPVTHQLVTWLISSEGTPRPPRVDGLADGRWVVSSDDRFGPEIMADLEEGGLDVVLADTSEGLPDLSGVMGFVAGGSDDAHNLALAAQARLAYPDLFLCIRQAFRRNEPLLDAFSPESVFLPPQMVTQEIMARITTPAFWQFVEHVRSQDDEWSGALIRQLVRLVGNGAPASTRLSVSYERAPAVVRRIADGGTVRIGDLLRKPDDRESTLAAMPATLIRRGAQIFLPPEEEVLQLGDELLLLGTSDGFDQMGSALYYDHVLEYVATGRQVPATWLWRKLAELRSA